MANTKPSDTFLGIADENDMVFLASGTASGASEMDITTGFDSATYSTYKVFLKAQPDTGAASVELLLYTDSTLRSTTYYAQGIAVDGGASSYPNYDNQGFFRLDGGLGMNTGTGLFSDITLHDMGAESDTSVYMTSLTHMTTNTSNRIGLFLNGHLTDFQDITGIRVRASSGNVTVESCRVYGIKKA